MAIAIVLLKASYSAFMPALEDHTSQMAEYIGKSQILDNASDESESDDSNIDGAVPSSDEEPKELELTDLSHS